MRSCKVHVWRAAEITMVLCTISEVSSNMKPENTNNLLLSCFLYPGLALWHRPYIVRFFER